MAELYSKIKKYAEANGVSNVDFLSDVELVNEGNGTYINKWNLDIAQPTDAQLDSYEDSANTQEALDTVRSNRKAEYPDIGDQLDMIWHLIDSGGTLDKTSDFYTSIKVVKDAHPKS